MSDQYWVKLRDDGLVDEQVLGESRPGKGWHKVDRLGDLARETWTPRKGWVPRDADALGAAIDAGHHADNGPWRREIDYAVKLIEARIILGTLKTDGLLAREAKLRGIDVEELARQVVFQAKAAEVELDRVAKKIALVAKP